MKLYFLLFLVLAVSLTCAKRIKVEAEDDAEDTQDVTPNLESVTEVNLAQQTIREYEQTTGADEKTTEADEQTTGADEQITDADEQTTSVDEQTSEVPEQTTGAPAQSNDVTDQLPVEPERTTEAPEQTTATSEQTSNGEHTTEQGSIDAEVQSTEAATELTSLITAIIPNTTTPTTPSTSATETTTVVSESTTNTPEVSTEDEPEPGLDSAEAVVDASVGKPGGRPYSMATTKYGFQVGLFINDGKKFCGGALLNEDWVITAASCLPPNSEVIAVLGLQYRYLTNASKKKSQIRLVDTYKVHEAYQANDRKNDIALVKLTRSADIDKEFIKAIRLPKKSQKLPVGLRATYPGFGKTNTGKVSPFLREARSTLLPKSYCQLRYLFSPVHDTNVCLSGILATGFCKGDVGGPLLSYENDLEPTLIGINSYVGGLGCSLTWPIVFTKVSPYVSWINTVTGIPIRT